MDEIYTDLTRSRVRQITFLFNLIRNITIGISGNTVSSKKIVFDLLAKYIFFNEIFFNTAISVFSQKKPFLRNEEYLI